MTRPAIEPRLSVAPRLTPLAASAIAVVVTVMIVVLDFATGPMINLAIFKSLVLMIAATARRRGFLWAMAILLVLTTYSMVLADLGNFPDPARRQAVLINRTFNAITLLMVAGVLHAWIGGDARNRSIASALDVQNRELAERAEEITRQNEELQSQTEELERQSEELRVANDELAQRERMLETLLDLSRSLRVGLSEDDALERICVTLAQLVNGPGSATAILLRDGDVMRVRCHHGFGSGGLREETIPIGQSFTALVMEQRRTGYLEDIALRPELRLPQPAAEGSAAVVSVLATPLVVRGNAIGALEVYSRDRRAWNEEQVSLVESLASQTSVSLENAMLFDEIDQGRRRLATILDSVPIGLAVADAALSDLRVNAAGAALLGVPPDTNVLDDFLRATWVVFEDGKQLSRDRYPIARGERVFPHDVEFVMSSGRRLSILSSAAPFYDADGKVVGAVSSFVDITQLKQLQRELEARRREAEEASVRKTRFLAAASHDIRTPANAISLLAELLKRTADSPAMAAEIPQLADELRVSATALVNLVSNVLDVTRFDTDKLELHEIDFPLSRLLEEESRQVLPLAQAKKLTLDVQPPAESIWLRADRIKLGRVLGNLLGNAIKFTDHGRISVSTSRVEEGAAVGNGDGTAAESSTRGGGATKQAGGVRITVSDTGIGISPEHQSHIFDEFWQLSDPQRSKGSGLGLAISKRLVEAMGGTLSVQSEMGSGSTFTVELPPDVVVIRASNTAAQT